MVTFKSTTGLGLLLVLCFCNARVWHLHDENIGALLQIRNGGACEIFDLPGILTAEAILYAIDEVNSGRHLDIAAKLGYDLRDSCPDVYGSTRDLVLRAQTGVQKSEFAAIVSSLPHENVETLLLLLTKRLPFVGCGSFARQTPDKHLDGAATKGKIFHTLPSDEMLLKAMSDVMGYVQLAQVVVIYDEQAIGPSALNFLEEETTNRNGCIIKTFGIQANEDVERQISRIGAELGANFTSVSAVVLLTPREMSASMMAEVARHGSLLHIIWIMGEHSWDSKGPERATPAAIILDSSGQNMSGFRAHLKRLQTDPLRNKWLNELVADRDLPGLPGWVPCADPTDPRCKINATALKRVLSELVAIADSATCIIDAVFAVGFALAARERCSSSCPPGEPLYESLMGVAFVSPTGRRVSFGEDGYLREVEYRVSVTQPLLRSHRVADQSLAVIGTWTSGQDGASRLKISPGHLATRPLPRDIHVPYCTDGCHRDQCKIYAKDPERGGCCWQCRDCHVVAAQRAGKSNDTPICSGGACPEHVVPDYVHWSDTGTLALLFVVAFGTCLGLYMTCVLLRNRSPVMARAKNATVPLLAFVLVIFLLPLLLLCKPTELSCEAYRAAFLFSLGIPLAALISKAQLVHDAFYDCDGNVKGNWTCCSPRTTVIFLVLLLHAIFFVAVRVSEPAQVLILSVPDSGSPFLECSIHSSISFPVTVLFLLIGAGLVSIMSLRDVSVPSNDFEVKWVSLCMFFWYILAFLYVALMFSVHGKYKILALGLVDFLHAFNLFACLYVPKWFVVVFRPERNYTGTSPFDPHLQGQEKVSLRLSSQGDQSPVMLKRGCRDNAVVNNNANNVSPEVKDTYV